MTSLEDRKAEYDKHVRDIRIQAVAWGLTYIFAVLVCIGGAAVDVAQRWGEALVLEFHVVTVVWVAALILAKIAFPQAQKHIAHDDHHKAEAGIRAMLGDDDEKLGD